MTFDFQKHELEVADLAARVRLLVWPLIQERPEALAILAEALARVTVQVSAEASRRGLAVQNPPSRPVAGKTHPCACSESAPCRMGGKCRCAGAVR